MSGFFEPGRGEDVDDLVGRDGPRDDLADGVVELLVGLALARRASWRAPPARPGRSRRRRGCASASSCGTASANACDSSRHGLQEPLLAVVLREDVLLRGGQQREPLRRRAGRPRATSRSRGRGRSRSRTSPASRRRPRPGRWRSRPCRRSRCRSASACLQLVGEAEVVDDQAARLVAEHAVHAGDRLHQPVAAHRLVDVHRVQARRVEAGQPHVAHDARSGTGRRGP